MPAVRDTFILYKREEGGQRLPSLFSRLIGLKEQKEESRRDGDHNKRAGIMWKGTGINWRWFLRPKFTSESSSPDVGRRYSQQLG